MLSRVFGVAALFACIVSAAAEEQPLSGAYKALGGSGLLMCGTFVAEIQKGPGADTVLGISVTSWVEGYITAYNATLAGSPEVSGDLAEGMTDQDVLNWVVDFCGEHPDEPIAAAASEAVMRLFQLASNRAHAE
jgi:hypothetical protein